MRGSPAGGVLKASWPALIGLVALFLSGCVFRPRAGVGGEVVRSVKFEGNGGSLQGTSDFNLRTAMEQRPSTRVLGLLVRSGVETLDPETLRVDGWRIESWYAHRGFFDARFLGWEIVERKPGREAREGCVARAAERATRRSAAGRRPGRVPACGVRAPLVDVVGYVDQGRGAEVRSVSWEGMEIVGAPLLALMERQAALQVGNRFDLDDLQETEDQALAQLQERSFAHAQVQGEAKACVPRRGKLPEACAEVAGKAPVVDATIRGEPGPACVFGPVSLPDVLSVRRDVVNDEIKVVPGEPYRASALARTQRNLFALGVFSVVSVVPDLSDPTADVVPVALELSESKFRQMRVGGGLAVESGRQEVHGSVDFRHVNLFNRLWRLELETSAGLASTTDLGDIEQGASSIDVGPVADVGARLVIPRFPARAWRMETKVGFEMGLEPNYRFASPSIVPSFIWRASEHLSLTLAYRLSYFSLIGDPMVPVDDLKLEFPDQYLLSAVSQQLLWDTRDDVLFTRRGALHSFELAEAGGPLAGGYDFIRARTDLRLYRPVNKLAPAQWRATAAARLGGGAIAPYDWAGSTGEVPLPERIFLGGASSVRGWALDAAGPYGYPCADGICPSQWGVAVGEFTDTAPVGGLLGVFGGLELREYLPVGLGFAAFSDFGMAFRDPSGLTLARLSPTAGLGLRYLSPIGPLRLDVAARLIDEPMYASFSRFGVHLALAEAY